MSKVAIIGSGFVGRAWAISFSRAGHDVALWDQDPQAPERALTYIRGLLPDFEASDLLNGVAAQAARPLRLRRGAFALRPTRASRISTSDLFPMLNRFKTFQGDWEPQALENSRDLVFRNTYKDIEFVVCTLSDSGTRFEFECYDTADLYNLSHFLQRGLVKPPRFVQTVFGILGVSVHIPRMCRT